MLSCCRTKVEKEVPYKSWSDFLKVASVPVTEVGGSSPGSSKPKRPKPFNITRTSFGQNSRFPRRFHCLKILTLSLAFFPTRKIACILIHLVSNYSKVSVFIFTKLVQILSPTRIKLLTLRRRFGPFDLLNCSRKWYKNNQR